jgi:ketosteroid isomerase-like protein
MALDRAELVRTTVASFDRGDPGPILEVLAPDVEWRNPPQAIEPGIRHGREEFEAVLRGLLESFDLETEIQELVELDGAVVTRIHVNGRARASGAPLNQRFFHVMRFEDDQLTAFEWYIDSPGALAAAGLSEWPSGWTASP